MEDLALRAPAPNERAELLDVWVAGWRATYPDIDFDARRDWLVARLADIEAVGAQTICAFGQTRMLGFVTIDPHIKWLDQLAVHPAAFGSGVARALLDQARRASPTGIELDVNVDNLRARRFYEREGFAIAGRGVNAISGRKTLLLKWRPDPGVAPQIGAASTR